MKTNLTETREQYETRLLSENEAFDAREARAENQMAMFLLFATSTIVMVCVQSIVMNLGW